MYFLYMFLLYTARTTNAGRINVYSLDLDKNPPPGTYDVPVEFDKVGVRGFGDVDYKQPVDDLAFDLPSYDDLEKAQENPFKSIFTKKEDVVPIFGSPRDQMLYYKNQEKRRKSKSKDPIMFDFGSILERNIAQANSDSAFKKHPYFNKIRDKKPVEVPKPNVSKIFNENSFYLRSSVKKVEWTTCEEFAVGAKFHPDDIMNTKWLPFYIWSTDTMDYANVHRFFYPNKQLVHFYNSTYGPYIRRKLNWKEPKIIMKAFTEMLLIAGDRKGLFYGVPRNELPESIRQKKYAYPVITLRMKIFDPYLALMHCDEKFATIMAELGTEPKTESEMKMEAGTLNFKGTGRPATRDVEFEKHHREFMRRQMEEGKKRKYIYGIGE